MFVFCVATTACNGGNTSCGNEPDVTGAWTLHLVPLGADGGIVPSIPTATDIEAQFEQGTATDFLGIGHHLYGSLTATDSRYFGTVHIPRLSKNDGSKSGALLGCTLAVHVPISTLVTDDNVDNGPLRISLSGSIIQKGKMLGNLSSSLILVDDDALTVRSFSWSAERR